MFDNISDSFLLVYFTVVLIVLFSIQLTLNRILKTLNEMKRQKEYRDKRSDRYE